MQMSPVARSHVSDDSTALTNQSGAWKGRPPVRSVERRAAPELCVKSLWTVTELHGELKHDQSEQATCARTGENRVFLRM